MQHDLPTDFDAPLAALGDLLAAAGYPVGLVVAGGTALNILGLVHRATRDIDVLGLRVATVGANAHIVPPPQPLPEPLATAIDHVAADFHLARDWVNTQVSTLWADTGVPPGLEGRVHWRSIGALDIGLVDRYDLIFLKLLAAADTTSSDIRTFRPNKHVHDLVALRPTAGELAAARAWVLTHDRSPHLAERLDRVTTFVHSRPR